MLGIEKEILILVSRVRCMTENQFGKVFGTRKKFKKKSFKKTLRKMCNDYTLRKYPCNINYSGYKDNSYVYYLNGSKQYKGKELIKVVVGSEVAIKLNNNGYDIKRFYRNISVGNLKYDLFVEYIDKYGDIKQILIDIKIDEKLNTSKYENMDEKIKKSTIPFFETPKVLVITGEEIDDLQRSRINKLDGEVEIVDIFLNKLFRYL